MHIQPIQNQQNNTSFKSVRIFKEIYPVRTSKMGISVMDDGKKGLVQLIDINAGIESVLGHSKDAVTLEGMLKNLGKNIMKDGNIAQVRELMKNVRERFKPEIEGWFEGPEKGLKKMLTQESLGSLDKAIKEGFPTYSEKCSTSDISPRILCLKDNKPQAVPDGRIVPGSDYIQEIDPLQIARENNDLL